MTMLKTAIAAILIFLSAATAVFGAPIPDTTFGSSGIVRLGVPSGREDTGNASTIQPGGKVIVVGLSSGRNGGGFIARFTASGAPDPTFGDSGTRTLATALAPILIPVQVHALANDSIIVLSNAAPGYALTRMNPDGSVDSSFGSAGTVVFENNGVLRGTLSDAPVAAAPQPDGKILVVTDLNERGSFTLRFRRFLVNGSPDPDFGPEGIRIVGNLPPNFALASARLAAIEPGGGMTLVARSTFFPGSYLVMRFSAAAALDPAFNNVGYASGVDLGNPSDFPVALSRGIDGSYAILGWNTFNLAVDNLLWRFDASGKSVRTFGVNGRLSLGGPAASNLGLAALPDGDLVVALQKLEATVRIARLDATGAPRAGFADNGTLVTSVPGYLAFRPVGIEYGGDGDLIVVGYGHSWISRMSNKRGKDVLLLGLSGNGVARTNFGRGDGTAIANNPAASNDTIDTLIVDPDGRITTIGYTDAEKRTDFLLTRLLPTGAPDTAFATAGRFSPSMAFDFAGAARAAQVPGQASGSIVVAAGNTSNPAASDASTRMVRVNNGVLDPTFNPVVVAGGRDSTVGVAARPDGRIVYLGESPVQTSGMTSYVVQQLLPKGLPDPAFGNNGRVSLPSSQFSNPFLGDVALLDDGSIAAAIFSPGGGLLYKLSSTGAIDTGFGFAASQTAGANGETHVSGNPRLLALRDGTFVTVAVTSRDIGFSSVLTVQIRRFSATGRQTDTGSLDTGLSSTIAAVALPDGSVVIGRTRTGSTATLTRLLPNDFFDLAFGGPVGTSVPFTSITALALTATGQLIVAGQDATSAIVTRYRLDSAVASVPVVEFFNVNLRHYFDTAGVEEIASIEAGGAGPGWQRTGNDFRAWGPQMGVPVGAVPVCRFYGTPGMYPCID